MPNYDWVIPQLTVLNKPQIKRIHESALKILSTTGVRIDSPTVIQCFVRKAGVKSVSGNCVRIPVDLVEWALHSAPSTIDIYDRRGNFAFRLGDDRTRFGIGVTTLFYQEPEDDRLTPFARRHMRDMVRLGSALPNYDVISTIGIVQDVPPHLSDLYGTLDMVANTTKPLVVLVSDEDSFPSVIRLLESLHGNLAEHPFIIPYFNPITPLVMNKGTLDKMQFAIDYGLPIIFSNYSMAGMSTPISPAGTLAVLIAELLAGLTISQIMRKGAPIILGILPAYFDMKTMVNFYDPQSILLNLACAEMMAHYHLPHCGTSGSGTGWGPDLLALETYWMNHMTACVNKVGLAPFVGDNLGSKAFSPVNVVSSHEIIEQSLRFARGFRFNQETVGLEEIRQVGPGGNFLSASSTLENFRQAYYQSPIFPRLSLEKWQAQARPAAIDLLRKYTLRLLENLPVPDDSAELTAHGEAFIKSLRVGL
jgi:trimethylamine--corrinoid protein Co-methyltransferase